MKPRQNRHPRQTANSMSIEWFALLFEPQLNAEQVMAIVKKHYKPFQPEYTPSRLALMTKFLIKRYNGAMYLGEVIENQRQGKGILSGHFLGILIYANGRAYEGLWHKDLKEGYGNELFPNKNRYEGFYVAGKPQGKGLYLWFNGELYDGQWEQGKKQGSGVWQGMKGDCYMGEWKDGGADGYGVHVWINGDRYEGQFKHNLKNGQGKEVFSNGDVYIGSYVDGKPDGYGEYYWKNGTIYKGHFTMGLRNGFGVWTKYLSQSQQEYEQYRGMYQNDKKAGIGVYEWPNGNIYKGQYDNDLRNGYGMMIWSDGSKYKGQWVDGTQQGEGLLSVQGQDPVHAVFVDSQVNQILKDPPRCQDLEMRIEQILEEIRDAGVNATQLPTNTITQSLVPQAAPARMSIGQKRITSNTQQQTTGSSFYGGNNPKSNLYDSLKIKLHSSHISRHNSAQHSSPYTDLSAPSELPRRKQKLSKSSPKHKNGQFKSQERIQDIQNVYSFEDVPERYKPSASKEHQENSEPYASFYQGTKIRYHQKPQTNQSYDFSGTKQGYDGYYLPLKKMSNTNKSERSSDSIVRHIERSRRIQSQQVKQKAWVPSGQVKRSPENVYISS